MANNNNIFIRVQAGAEQARRELRGVVDGMRRLSTRTNTTSASFGTFYSQARRVNNQLHNITIDANRSADSIVKLTRTLNMGLGAGKAMVLADTMAKVVQSAFDMIETQNLFAVSMGENIDTATEFANSINEAFDFDVTNIQNAIGTFGLLSRSMGMSSDNAEILAENTAKLAYDLSSLTNVPINQVMQDLRSGLVGQSETMYKYGVDVTEASLKQEALNQGIEKSVRNMSQGEKMALRYSVMIRQTSLAHGDFAKTMQTPANQLKILGEQFITLGRVIGSWFIPMLSAILPVANAVVAVLIRMAKAIASFLGVKMEDPVKTLHGNAIGASNAVDGIGDSADKASKKLKKMKDYALGFDELHVISPDTGVGTGTGAGAGGVGGGIGGLADIDLTGYDNMMDKIKGIGEELEKKVEPILKRILIIVGLISLGLISWTIAGFILNIEIGTGALIEFYTMVKRIGLMTTLFGFYPQLIGAIGIFGILTGLGLTIYNVFKMLDGIDFSELIGSLVGIGLTSGGIFLLAKALGTTWEVAKKFSAIGLILGGIVLTLIGLKEIFENSKPSIEAFITAISGIALITGGFILAGLTITGIVVGIVGIIAVLALAIYKYWDEIKEWTSNMVEMIKNKFEEWKDNLYIFATVTIPEIINNIIILFMELPDKIGYILGVIIATFANWAIESINWIIINVPLIIESILSFFRELPNKIGLVLNSFKTTISTWITNGISWVKESLPKLLNEIIRWFSKLPETTDKVGENLIKGLWNGMMKMGDWLKDKIVGLLGGLAQFATSFTSGIGAGMKATFTSVPQFADGGFVDAGQMFIANEAGAEMVGSIGGRTAVVNNDQIVEAVSSGVARAVAFVLGDKQEQPLVVTLDGDVIYNNQQKVSQRRGNNFGLGAFAR